MNFLWPDRSWMSSAAIPSWKIMEEGRVNTRHKFIQCWSLLSPLDFFGLKKATCAHAHFRISSKWLHFRELHSFNGSSSASSKVTTQLFSAILLFPVSISQMEWKKFLNVCVWLYIRNKIWTLITIIGFPPSLENISYFKTNTCVTSCQMPFLKSTSSWNSLFSMYYYSFIGSVNFFGYYENTAPTSTPRIYMVRKSFTWIFLFGTDIINSSNFQDEMLILFFPPQIPCLLRRKELSWKYITW